MLAAVDYQGSWHGRIRFPRMNRRLATARAKDEEKYLLWVIEFLGDRRATPASRLMGDRRTNSTASIIDRAVQLHLWIEPHHLAPKVPHGEAGESVIMPFPPRKTWKQYDYIFRLDADTSFGAELARKPWSSRNHATAAQSPKCGGM